MRLDIEFLKQQMFLANSLFDYLICVLIIFIGVVLFRLIKSLVFKRVKEFTAATEAKLDDIIFEYIEKALIPIIDFGIVYLAITQLNLPNILSKILNILAVIILAVNAIRFITGVITKSLDIYFFAKQETYKAVLILLKVVIWSIGIIFLLDNLGFKISTVVAGLGIGGVALALAAQTVLADLFCYIAILLDKPFELGDFIVVDDKKGNVDHIGLKTTRLVSLDGEQLIFSNSDLTRSRVQNFKRMERRRAIFNIGVTYQTSLEKLKEIPVVVKDIIGSLACAEYDRCHFFSYGDYSLNYEIVYYVLSKEYNIYMDVQQEINLKIFKEFEKRSIEFAYPTQTLLVEKKV